MYFSKNFRLYNLITVAVFSCLLAYGLYHRALYFYPDNVQLGTVMLILSAVALFYLYIKNRISTPAWAVILLMYSTYVSLSVLWGADRALATRFAIVTWCALGVTLAVYGLDRKWKRVLLQVIAASAVVLYLFALFVSLSWVHYQDAIQFNMMDSVFQYHNTFGAYSLVGFAISVLLLIDARGTVQRCLLQLITSVSFLAAILSYSREVWLLCVLLLMVTAFQWLRARGVVSTLVNVGTPAFVALVCVPIATAVIKNHSLVAFLLLLAVHALTPLILGSLDKVRSKGKFGPVVAMFAAVSAAIVVAIIWAVYKGKFVDILSRLQSINLHDFSFQERLWYYATAFNVWSGHPIFGLSGGAWESTYQTYELFPFTSTTPHSIFFSQLTNFGLVGMGLWIAFVYLAIRSGIKQIKSPQHHPDTVALAGLVAGCTLLLHSCFDFDMDFGMVSIIFVVLLGVATTEGTYDSEWKAGTVRRGTWAVPFSLLLMAHSGLAFTQWLSASAVTKANLPSTAGNRVNAYKQAITLAPYDGALRMALASTYFNLYAKAKSQEDMTSAWNETREAVNEVPWNPKLLQTAAVIAYQLKHGQEAYNWSLSAYTHGKYHVEYASTFMSIAFWEAVNTHKSDPATAALVFHKVVDTYNDINSNTQGLKTLPSDIHPEWGFGPNVQVSLFAAGAEYCLGNYPAARNIIASVPTTGLDSGADQLRVLLTSLIDVKVGEISETEAIKAVGLKSPALLQSYSELSEIGP